jgi:hypothetical protein
MGRISVKVAPEPVGFHGNVARTPVARTLKDGVFDEVADAVELSGFVTRASTHPNSGGYRPQTGHMFGQDGDSVREFGRFNLVDHRENPQNQGELNRVA